MTTAALLCSPPACRKRAPASSARCRLSVVLRDLRRSRRVARWCGASLAQVARGNIRSFTQPPSKKKKKTAQGRARTSPFSYYAPLDDLYVVTWVGFLGPTSVTSGCTASTFSFRSARRCCAPPVERRAAGRVALSNLTAAETLAFLLPNCTACHSPSADTRRRSARCGRVDRLARTTSVDTYSGGMRRRLNLGCALVSEPRAGLLDDPTAPSTPVSSHISTPCRARAPRTTILYRQPHQLKGIREGLAPHIADHGDGRSSRAVPFPSCWLCPHDRGRRAAPARASQTTASLRAIDGVRSVEAVGLYAHLHRARAQVLPRLYRCGVRARAHAWSAPLVTR